MFYTTIQYIFIAVVFVFAVYYVIGMFKTSFGKKEGGNCSKGCGCSGIDVDLDKDKK